MDVYVQGLDDIAVATRPRLLPIWSARRSSNPDLRMPHSVLGDIYFSGGNLERALVQYKEMVRLDPYAAVNHYRLGLTYQLMHKLQDAAAAYLRALQLDPRDPKTNMNLGLVYLALNQEEDALKYLRRATELAPNSAERGRITARSSIFAASCPKPRAHTSIPWKSTAHRTRRSSTSGSTSSRREERTKPSASCSRR